MMHTGPARDPARSRLAGYLFALAAGSFWGTTGTLSTALYAEGAQLTAVGFWRILLATLGFLVYGVARRDLFRVDRLGWLLVAGVGGLLVAIFEVSYQYAIAGAGVAGAATLLYTAPVLVALLAKPLLGEAITALRVFLATVVMVGVALTVTGGQGAPLDAPLVGVIGGLLAALSYAGTTLLARWAVPRYGAVRVLFLELAGGSLLLGVFLPLSGRAPIPPASVPAWVYVAGLGVGSVLLANFCFFAAVRRIEAAPTAVAASIEPVVSALLGLLLLAQTLTLLGWVGLFLVVGGVAGGYVKEARVAATPAPAPRRGALALE
ncbi:MAG: DMT family transporter [Gemmatimonadetes bacterium]|nr:DMT family transporter [Gemmatimonadota bacterium]